MKPRLLLVARTRYRLPLTPSLELKFAALRARFDLRVLAASADGRAHDDGTFRLVPRSPILDGPLFWLLLPGRLRAAVREHRPDAILVQSAYEAAFAHLARTRVPVLVELHGDWRTATRLYGSPLRRALSPLADAAGAWGIRRAAGVRTLSPYTTQLVRELGREPEAEFIAFVDLELFLDRPPVPLPERRQALFVGVLERYKNIDGLVSTWRRAAAQVPHARLQFVGDGSRRDLVEALLREGSGQAAWAPRLAPEQVARMLDDSTVLLLPSRSEGLPRIVVEAFCRGRPVIARPVGGIPDLVEDGVNGLLVDGDDELLAALVRVLCDSELAERLARGAQASAARWVASPDDFAARVEALVRPYTGSP